MIDEYVQRQLRVETSGGSYASLRAQFYQRIQQIYGVPGSASAFETVFNNFIRARSSFSDSSGIHKSCEQCESSVVRAMEAAYGPSLQP